MGKMNELSMILDEMITAGNQMVKAATALKEHYSKEDVGPGTETVKETSQLIIEKKIETATSKEEVRKLLAEKSSSNDGQYKQQVIALVKKYGNGGSFRNVPESDYAALVKEVEEITNA